MLEPINASETLFMKERWITCRWNNVWQSAQQLIRTCVARTNGQGYVNSVHVANQLQKRTLKANPVPIYIRWGLLQTIPKVSRLWTSCWSNMLRWHPLHGKLWQTRKLSLTNVSRPRLVQVYSQRGCLRHGLRAPQTEPRRPKRDPQTGGVCKNYFGASNL